MRSIFVILKDNVKRRLVQLVAYLFHILRLSGRVLHQQALSRRIHLTHDHIQAFIAHVYFHDHLFRSGGIFIII